MADLAQKSPGEQGAARQCRQFRIHVEIPVPAGQYGEFVPEAAAEMEGKLCILPLTREIHGLPVCPGEFC